MFLGIELQGSFDAPQFKEGTKLNKTQDEYIAKIRKKLNEWKYIPNIESRVNASTFTDVSSPLTTALFRENIPVDNSRMTVKSSRSNHQRHQSGPLMPTHRDVRQDFTAESFAPLSNSSTVGGGGNGNTNRDCTSVFDLHSAHHAYAHLEGGCQSRNSHRVRPGSAGHLKEHLEGQSTRIATSNQYSPQLKPQGALGRSATSPRSQPMSQSMTSMSDTSSTSSGQEAFVDIFNPKFLSTINLNDPTIRAVWISSVWEYFRSGGQWHGYGHLIGDNYSGSQNSSHGTSKEPRNHQRDPSIKLERHASLRLPEDIEMSDTSDNVYPQYLNNNPGRRTSVDSSLNSGLLYHQRLGHSKSDQIGQLSGTEGLWGDHPIALQLGMSSLDGVMVNELPADAWSKFGTLKPGNHHQ